MKKVTLIALVFLNVTFAYAQENKLKFSVYTTWDYSNTPEIDFIDQRGKLAFGLGLQTSYEVNKHFDFVIGAAYIDKGYNQEITGPGSTDGIETRLSHWRFNYFSVPAKLQYRFRRGDYNWYFAGGIENDFSFGGSGRYKFEDFAQSVVMNIGVSKDIGEKLRIGFEPTVRQSIKIYGTSNTNTRTLPDLKPYSIGLKVILTKVKYA